MPRNEAEIRRSIPTGAQSPRTTAVSESSSKSNFSNRHFTESILKMNSATWNELEKEDKEQVLFDFWIQTSWGKGFPWTMNLVLQRTLTGQGALAAFMLLFSEGKHLDKKGVVWKTTEKHKDSVRVACIWKDEWNRKRYVQGAGTTIEQARADAAEKSLKIIVYCSEDLRALQHVHSPFMYDGPQSERVNISVLWDRLKEAKLQEISRREEQQDSQTNSSQTSATRYFDDGILQITPDFWNTLRKDAREEILFSFWIKASWGEGFPWTMNLAQQRNLTGCGALQAFMLLFSEGRFLSKKGVKWETISQEKDSVRVKCTWYDEWGQTHCKEGTGTSLNRARNDTAEKALRIVFCPEDLRVLQHVHSPFIYDGPECVDSQLLWDRLKAAKLRENGPSLQARACLEGRRRKLRLRCRRRKDRFAEYFSNNEDGTLDIPEWITEKYLKPSSEPTEALYDDISGSSDDAITVLDKTSNGTDIPYLPFDRIIGYEYPQEATKALQLLFEGSKHTKPKLDLKNYVLAEVQVGSKVFQALGLTEEEAQQAAAAKAVEALSHNKHDESLKS